MDIEIKIYGIKLSRCEFYTYLGVEIDECLTFQKHFKYICRQFAQNIFQLSKKKNYTDQTTRVLLYKQTILPLVEYADIMRNHVRNHDLEKLQRLQNKSLRICLDIINPRDIGIAELHSRVNLRPLHDRREIHLMNLMYKYRAHKNWLHEVVLNTSKLNGVLFFMTTNCSYVTCY